MKSPQFLTDAQFQEMFPVLECVPLSDVTQLRTRMTERRYKKQAVLMEKGECGKLVLFMAGGCIKVMARGECDKATVISFCARGELLGEINALTPGGHSADVIAEEPCFAWGLPVEDFLSCLAVMPRLSLNISRLLAQRMRKATQQLHQLASASAEQRVAYNLSAITERINPAEAASVAAPSAVKKLPQGVDLSISVADLSSMSGCSREQVHRALRKLRDEALIDRVEGGIRILHLAGLKEFYREKMN